MADEPTAPSTSVTPIALAVFGFLIILSLGGGLSGGLVPDSQPDNTDNTEAVISTPSKDSNSGDGWFINSATESSGASGASDDAVAVVDTRAPAITTLPALNIEDKSASLRGEVDMYAKEDGVVFLVYGYNLKDVRDVSSSYRTFEQIPEATSDRVRTYRLDRRAEGQEDYNRRISNLVPDTSYYYQICVEYNVTETVRTIKCGTVKIFKTNASYSDSNRFRTPSVSVDRALNVTGNSALLGGSVTMNDGIDGIVFFAYGEDKEFVDDVENFTTYQAVDEEGDNLQKVRVGTFVRGKAEYSKEIDELDGNKLHYYRLCVEYDGEESGLKCSGVSNFTTDRRNRNVLPYAETVSAKNVSGKIEFTGLVQMNDYNDGIAFFVVGTDKELVEEAEIKNEFTDISQSDLRLQKAVYDNDVDGTSTYTRTLDILTPGTYWYRTCVQYVAEDENGREKDFLRCGEMKSFTL